MKPDEREFLLAVLNRPEALGACPITGRSSTGPTEMVWEVGFRLGMNHKRVRCLCLKWSDKGWFEWGTSPGYGWLTKEGIAKARELAIAT